MKIAYKLRFIPMIIFAISTVTIFAKFSGVSLPYQDPTADMLQKQSQHISMLENWLTISVLLFAASAVYCIVIIKLSKH